MLPNNGNLGLTDYDSGGSPVEAGINLPIANRNANWVYYDVTLGCMLDSGIVVHQRLPQVDNAADTLASCNITDANIDSITGRGVNLVSSDVYQDIVQRMAHSRYWFRLWGQAMRVGQQVPIPGLKTISGVTAIPHDKNPQWAYNKIVGNYSGQVLWYAYWDLWYTLASPPKVQQVPPQNPGVHIAGNAPALDSIQVPYTQPDDDAVQQPPPVGIAGI